MAAEHLVVTGRSGAGVSTTAVNLSAAIAEQGYRVAHLGYDRRRISTGSLRGQSPLVPACDSRCHSRCRHEKPHCATGYLGILCIECGVEGEEDLAPEFPLVGRMELIGRFCPDYVVHDISGDPATVLPFLSHEDEPARLFLVTSSDFAAVTTMNLYLAKLEKPRYRTLRFGGIIANNISGAFSETLVQDFAREAGTRPIVSIPHSLMVSVAEYASQSVMESAPRSHLSTVYRKLARIAVQGLAVDVPRKLEPAALAAWQRKWSEITEEFESGLVRDGAAI